MEYKNWTDAIIVNTRVPLVQVFWIEINSSGIIYCIPDGALNLITKTIDKGDNWSTIETRTNTIGASPYYDRANDKVYFVSTSATTSFPFYIDTTDDSVTDLGNYTAGNSEIAKSIFTIGANIYTLNFYNDGANWNIRIRIWNDPNWDVDTTQVMPNVFNTGWVVVIGTLAYFIVEDAVAGDMTVTYFDSVANSIVEKDDITATPMLMGNGGQISYDDDNLLFFGIRTGGVDYLAKYSITGDLITQLGATTMVIMMNWQTASGVLEKGFKWGGDGNEIYQLHNQTKRWHLIAKLAIPGKHIIAISDNFLILKDD